MGGSIYSKTQVSGEVVFFFPSHCFWLWLQRVFSGHVHLCCKLHLIYFFWITKILNSLFVQIFGALMSLMVLSSVTVSPVFWQAGLPHRDASSFQPAVGLGWDGPPEPWRCTWLRTCPLPPHPATTPTAPLTTAAPPPHSGRTGNKNLTEENTCLKSLKCRWWVKLYEFKSLYINFFPKTILSFIHKQVGCKLLTWAWQIIWHRQDVHDKYCFYFTALQNSSTHSLHTMAWKDNDVWSTSNIWQLKKTKTK